MPLRQYVYFALSSRRITAQEITDLLGIEPDETRVINPRRLPADPAKPFRQVWQVVCREPGLHVDEQIARVLGRLRPQTDRIAELMKQFNSAEDQGEPGLEAWLEVVRYFNDDEQEEETGQPRQGRSTTSSAGRWTAKPSNFLPLLARFWTSMSTT
ncbi:DUF4279 domain-containing protein [Streptomyces sp. SM1P]